MVNLATRATSAFFWLAYSSCIRCISRSHCLLRSVKSSCASYSLRLAISVRRFISASFSANAASFSAKYCRPYCSMALACCSMALACYPNAWFSAASYLNFPAASILYLRFSDSVSCSRRIKCSSLFWGKGGLTDYLSAGPCDCLEGWLGVVVGVPSPSYLPLLRVIPWLDIWED